MGSWLGGIVCNAHGYSFVVWTCNAVGRRTLERPMDGSKVGRASLFLQPSNTLLFTQPSSFILNPRPVASGTLACQHITSNCFRSSQSGHLEELTACGESTYRLTHAWQRVWQIDMLSSHAGTNAHSAHMSLGRCPGIRFANGAQSTAGNVGCIA